MAAMPESAIGRQLLSIEDQPATCGPYCPCNTDLRYPMRYSARWTPDTTKGELMGLDITAYSRLTRVGLHTADWAECEDDTHIQAFAYDSFPLSFHGIDVVARENGLVIGGCYATTDATTTHRFHAGSYSGYGAWRDDLQRQFNPDRHPDKPFYELIWFADNEGAIGPAAAARLLADFREHVDAYQAQDSYYGLKYADWTRAAELAAAGGLIDFH